MITKEELIHENGLNVCKNCGTRDYNLDRMTICPEKVCQMFINMQKLINGDSKDGVREKEISRLSRELAAAREEALMFRNGLTTSNALLREIRDESRSLRRLIGAMYSASERRPLSNEDNELLKQVMASLREEEEGP